eukprot:TRINITY_DN76489_c0_g1_i1.p1 TRINITY_DN76489_c0_g1~~TRINITY_DN76489_c0_g1_i1.p1  ORF type:complete len:644 (+),score=130.44 TRINITY_DN76489_c0_g1_i1:87-2018(+)
MVDTPGDTPSGTSSSHPSSIVADVCDTRSALVAQQQQLDSLVDKVAALVSAVHTEVMEEVRQYCERGFDRNEAVTEGILAEIRKTNAAVAAASEHGEARIEYVVAELRSRNVTATAATERGVAEMRRTEGELRALIDSKFDSMQEHLRELDTAQDRLTADLGGVSGRIGSEIDCVYKRLNSEVQGLCGRLHDGLRRVDERLRDGFQSVDERFGKSLLGRNEKIEEASLLDPSRRSADRGDGNSGWLGLKRGGACTSGGANGSEAMLAAMERSHAELRDEVRQDVHSSIERSHDELREEVLAASSRANSRLLPLEELLRHAASPAHMSLHDPRMQAVGLLEEGQRLLAARLEQLEVTIRELLIYVDQFSPETLEAHAQDYRRRLDACVAASTETSTRLDGFEQWQKRVEDDSRCVRIEALRDRVGASDTRLDELHERLESLATSVQQHRRGRDNDQRLSELDVRLEALASLVQQESRNTARRVGESVERAETAEAAVEALQRNAAEIKGEVRALTANRSVGTNDHGAAHVDARISQLQGGVQRVGDELRQEFDARIKQTQSSAHRLAENLRCELEKRTQQCQAFAQRLVDDIQSVVDARLSREACSMHRLADELRHDFEAHRGRSLAALRGTSRPSVDHLAALR